MFDRAGVHQRVHGVEAEPVEVVVPQPHPGVIDDERAHLVGSRLVEVDRRAPRGQVRVGEVRPERGQPVARADVVVDDVQVDGQAARVAGVHEALERVRPAVGLVHRPQADSVVPPAVIAGERGHRHQLHHRNAEIGQVVKPPDRGVQRPLRGERADVQLVDHRAGRRRAPPASVRPGERRVVVGPAPAGRTRRLPGRAGVGQRLAAVKPERVVGPGQADRARHIGAPPPRPASRRHRVQPSGHVDVHPSGGRRHTLKTVT